MKNKLSSNGMAAAYVKHILAYIRKLNEMRNNIDNVKMEEKSIKLAKIGYRKRKRKKTRKREK